MSEYCIVQLSKLFNEKLMTTKEEKQKCLDVLGNCGFRNQDWHMFNADSLPDSNEVIEINGVPFLFPDKSYSKYDAIACESQLIPLEERVYHDVYLLGTAFDCCEGLEEIQLTGKRGEMLQKKVYFHDWYFAKANTNWDYNRLHKKRFDSEISGTHLSDLSKRSIYVMHISIDSEDIELNGMILPLNPDIHIFGVTMVQ